MDAAGGWGGPPHLTVRQAEVTGLEPSAAQLRLLEYVFLGAATRGELKFHPFIDDFRDNLAHECRLEPCVAPVPLPCPHVAKRLRFVGGTLEDLGARHEFDAAVTCFVIDCFDEGLPAFLEAVHAALRPGGTWVNLGRVSACWGLRLGDR